MEIKRVAELHATFFGVRKYIDCVISRDYVSMNEYFGDNLASNNVLYCFSKSKFIFFLIW